MKSHLERNLKNLVKKLSESEKQEKGEHVKSVLDNMNKLLSETPVRALVDCTDYGNEEYVAIF